MTTAPASRRGLLLILSSPSGAGKSTLARRLMQWDATMRFSVSATTRAPRPGEVDGEHYFFRSRADFESMVAAGEMLEHAEVFGNFYGRAASRSAIRPLGAMWCRFSCCRPRSPNWTAACARAGRTATR